MPKKTTKKIETDLPFEDALAELEALVEKMEAGDLSLEQSLESFERGITLTRTCEKALKEAEQKVEILSGSGKGASLEPFSVDD